MIMKGNKMKCFVCDEGTFKRQEERIEGLVRGEKHAVSMEAMVCDVCGHVALEGKDVQEFMRRLADAYRHQHGLLTSDEIRAIRGEMSQVEFARELGVGVASIKRWELGKIQTEHADRTIRAFECRSIAMWVAYEPGDLSEYRDAVRLEAGLAGLPNGPPILRSNTPNMVPNAEVLI